MTGLGSIGSIPVGGAGDVSFAAWPDLLLSDSIVDNGLALLQNAERIYLCDQLPTTYAEATSDFALGYGTAQFSAPTSLHTVTSAAVSDGTITTDGLAMVWAAVDVSESTLLACGMLDPVGVDEASGFTLESFVIDVNEALYVD